MVRRLHRACLQFYDLLVLTFFHSSRPEYERGNIWPNLSCTCCHNGRSHPVDQEVGVLLVFLFFFFLLTQLQYEANLTRWPCTFLAKTKRKLITVSLLKFATLRDTH